MPGVFVFTGNSAIEGGDVMYGGCLANCMVNNETMSKCDPTSTFWDIMSLTNLKVLAKLQSAIVGHPTKVAFCTSSSSFKCDSSCNNSLTISIYRGQIFTVPLMTADDYCFPSVKLIEAEVIEGGTWKSPPRFEQDVGMIQKSRKHCHTFSYTLIGGLELASNLVCENKAFLLPL